MRRTLAFTFGLCAAIGCRDDAEPGTESHLDDSGTGGTPADGDSDPQASLTNVASPADLACALTFTVTHEAWALPVDVRLTGPDGRVQTRPVHWDGQTGRVVGLRADTDYTLQVELVAGEGEPDPPTLQAVASTGALPADLPELTLSASDEARSSDEITVFPVARWNPMTDPGWGYVLAVDSEGEVVWYWDASTLMVAFHVESDADGVPWVYTSDFLSTAVAVSPFTGEVRRLEASAMGLDSVHHEVRPLPGGGLALLSSELEPIGGFDGQTYNIVADLLVEAEWDGTVTYEAGILDHVDPTTIYTADMHSPFWEAGPYATVPSPKDWSHGNAMELDAPGDQWIVSFRNLDWLMAFDRASGAPNWAFGPLGDFTLAEGSRWASRQHSPEVTPEGTLLVYDNGLRRADAETGEAPFSRVVEYRLDTDAMVASEVWSWAGNTPYLCPIAGDVNRLASGRHLITDGSVVGGVVDLGDGNTINHMTARIREIVGTESPEVVWELVVGRPGETTEPGATVYRAERVESLSPEW